MTDTGDIGEYQRAGVVQRLQRRRRRSDAGDDNLGPVPQQHLKILRKPRIGAMHNQVRTDRRRKFSAVL
jgi:hypothetical protein